MQDDPAKLTPADPDDLRFALSFALQHDGRRRYKHGDELMAKIVADHLVRHLELANFVVMQGPPLRGHSTPGPKPTDQEQSG
jgi:hypothetical protein